MKKTQFEQLVIDDYETTVYPLPRHGHTYYEIIYIHKGSGNHHLNNTIIEYTAGDVFLVSPGDVHLFTVEKSTHFTFIKFTDSYFSGHALHRTDAGGSGNPESIMQNRMLKEKKLVIPTPLQSALRYCVQNIIAYNNYATLANSVFIYHQVLSVFGLITEAAAAMSIRIDNGQPQKEQLITYIHKNIYFPYKLHIKHISSCFGISPTYFGNYFRRNFGIAYRDYTNGYKMGLIEERLKIKSFPINKIAAEFNFTDESHLSHFFRRMKKMTPLQFRNL